MIEESLYDSIGEWATISLPEATPVNHITKLKNEADEVILDPSDVKEYADCMIALCAAAYKSGISHDDLMTAVESKLEVNWNRSWVLLPDGTHQHV